MAASCHPPEGPGTPRRKSRRSWFDAPPLTTLDPPQMPKPEVKKDAPKCHSLDTVETLTLTHFTNPPRLGFGKTLVGRTKLRTLLIRNPHDYEQEVIIERFPFKKKFMVDHTRFIVGPEDIFSLEVRWTPEEDGGFREMIQFHINEIYRLQAFLFGTAEKPKPPRKARKHHLGPRVRQPANVLQTPALTNIKTSYSPRRSQEMRELMDEFTLQHQEEDKENSGSQNTNNETAKIQEGNIINLNPNSSKSEDMTKLNSSDQKKDRVVKKAEEEILRSPPPLESTTIAGKPEMLPGNHKNRRQWRNISDITNPTLNMSPIPLSEGNENGITVDSYFHPNETTVSGLAKSDKGAELKIRSADEDMVEDQKYDKSSKELVIPQPPVGQEITSEMKRLETVSSEDRRIVAPEKSEPTYTVGSVTFQTVKSDETQVIRQNVTHLVGSGCIVNSQEPPAERTKYCSAETKNDTDSNKMEMKRSDWTSPKTYEGMNTSRASPISPRTLLDESLTLISQMKMVARNDSISAGDGNASINSSLISQGQGMVSPHSFLEDMKNMVNEGSKNGSQNTSTPHGFSPSTVLNNSIPHNIMLSHLENVRSSLHNTPPPAIFTIMGGKGTPKKGPSVQIPKKRRSITAQFQKEEERKIAIAARVVKKDKESLAIKPNQIKGLALKKRRSPPGKRHSMGRPGVPSPRRGTFVMKNKSAELKRGASKKRSPTRSAPVKAICKGTKDKVTNGKTFLNSNGRPGLKPKSQSLIEIENLGKVESACQQANDKLDLHTPKKEQDTMDIGMVIKCRSLETGTVVKRKSTGGPEGNTATVVKRKCSESSSETGGKYFDDLFEGKDADGSQNNSQRDASMIRRGKLFPDIEVSDTCEMKEQVLESELVLSEVKSQASAKNVQGITDHIQDDDSKSKQVDKVSDQDSAVMSSKEIIIKTEDTEEVTTEECSSISISTSRMSHFERAMKAAERSMSPQRFHPMSPGNLPTSPATGLEHSRRGTLTVTKSRPSDALLQAMNNRKRLFIDSDQPSKAFIQEDDTETQENIVVKVEEHYHEVDGKMYLVVKETTDVIKSITETYFEQLAVSPQQFQTPTRLPNSPDPQVSRRSTHVVRSPKVIDLAAMNKKRLEFSEKDEVSNILKEKELEKQGKEEITESKEAKHDTTGAKSPDASSDSLETTHNRTKSDTFEKEPTVIPTLNKKGLREMEDLQSIRDSDHPITAICAMSPRLVDYDDVHSENGSSANDVTRDSLETNQSLDSLETSAEIARKSEDNRGKGNEATSDIHNAIDRQTISVSKTTGDKVNSLTENQDLCHVKEEQEVNANTAYDSEDEKYYDTMSERYYDALSDTLNVDLEEDQKLIGCETANPEADDVADFKHGAEDNAAILNFEKCKCQKSSTGESRTELYDQQVLLDNTAALNKVDDLRKCVLQGTNEIIEKATDHKEIFQVMERVRFTAEPDEQLPLAEKIISNTREGKSKEKLRRSMSICALSQSAFTVDVSDTVTDLKQVSQSQGNGKTVPAKRSLAQSKSAVFARPVGQVPRRNLPNQRSLNKDQDAGIKQRSQSLTNLSKKVESEKKTVPKMTPNMARMAPTSKTVSLVSSRRQKGPTKGVAQRKLILVKQSKTSAPRHPMPFAARNMYYDERWIDKQERGFVQWLNFVLTPPDEYVTVTNKAKVDAGSLSLDHRPVAPRLAPTKEILSFRAYALRRSLNRLRRAACEFYQSDTVANIICKVETEVESRRIAVRKDRMVHADLGIKQRLLDLLLQYSSLWLRIGLETVFGEVLMVQSNQDVVGLSRFIITRLLACPDIAAEFAHPTVPHLYKDGYAAAVSRHTVKKFLLLVYFMDQAKTVHLIDHDPCLFCKDADIKSSKEILIQFSREILSGEGDITRHLAYMGYTVSQIQKPIDEFDFAVTNLSSDLRDGLRLSRVLELLANNRNIMGKLRTPAISRLQKIHNTENFFKAMSERGLDLSSLPSTPVTARDIVDGHREKTLVLLWHLIIHFQSCIQVNETQLKEEINILTKSLRLKLAMQNIGAISVADFQARRDSGETRLLMENERLQLIFQWCRLVCLHYGIKVENFTVSFSDGRALCCLLHHYHPALLPLSDIKFVTTVSFQEAMEEKWHSETDPDNGGDWTKNRGDLMPGVNWHTIVQQGNDETLEIYQQLLANEKANFKVLYEKVSALSGVPLMLRFADMSNTIPDEKVVSTYVSYLCARLLDIREEVRAARRIQMAWRRRQLRIAIKERERKTEAAIRIQRWIRPYLAKQILAVKAKAATNIQAVWRGHQARTQAVRLKEKQQEHAWRAKEERAARALQNLWRCRSARQQLAKLRLERQNERLRQEEEEAAKILQKYWRGRRSKKNYLLQRQSIIKIQAVWRKQMAKNLLQALKQERLHKSASVIQRWTKRHFCRTLYARQKECAILLQKNWRMRQAQLKLKNLKAEKQDRAAITIQNFFRGRVARQHLQQLKLERENRAATVVQSILKTSLCRREFLKKKCAAVLVQKHWRRKLAEKELNKLKHDRDNRAATVIQKRMRGYKGRKEFDTIKRATVILQSFCRMLQAQSQIKILRAQLWTKSAVTIQKHFRGIMCRHQFIQYKKAAVVVQKNWRRCQAQKLLLKLRCEQQNQVVIVIQTWWRGLRKKQDFAAVKSAIIVIQKNWRMRAARQELERLKNQQREFAAVILQKNVRSWQCRRAYLKVRRAAIQLQSLWRRWQAQKVLAVLRLEQHGKAAVVIQKMWKGHVIRQRFVEMRNAAVVLQSYWKMVLTRQRHSLMHEAAMLIQEWHRGNMAARKQQTVYLQQRQAIICIQSWWKCRRQKQKFVTLKKAATLIQAAFRGFRRRLKYQALRLATVIVQRGYRHYLEGKKIREEYLALKRAAVVLQRSIRGYLERKSIRQEASALVLQTAFRRFTAHQKYLRQRRAAELIQRSLRSYREMKKMRQTFLQQREAARTIQFAYRSFRVKKHYKHVCDSVIKVQALVRGRQAKNHYLYMKWAAVTIQRRYRAVKLGFIFREAFLLIQSSAVKVQQFYRAVQARRRVQRELRLQHRAVTKVQALYRGWSQRQDYREMQSAAICLQRRYRAYRIGKCVKNEFVQKIRAVRIIQAKWHSYLQIQEAKMELQERKEKVKREIERQLKEQRLKQERINAEKRKEFEKRVENMRREKAAVILQRSVRAFLIMRDYMKREKAAITIQKYVKGYQARVLYVNDHRKILWLQLLMRGFTCRRGFERMKLAATIIQTRWREVREGRKCQADFISLKQASVKIQAYLRMRFHRQKYQQIVRQVTLIQSCVRMFLERQRYLKLKRSAVYMQRQIRHTQMMRRDRAAFLNLRKSAIKIQLVVRVWLAYKQAQRERSVIKLQTCWTMQRERAVSCQDSEVLCILNIFTEAKQQQIDRQAKEMAAKAIQRKFREYQRHHVDRKLAAAHVIQRALKQAVRQRKERENSAVYVIQRNVRRFARLRIIRKQRSAIIVQTMVRRFLARQKYLAIYRSVISLQAATRGWRARQLVESLRRRHRAAICLQTAARGFLTRKKTEPILRERLQAIEERRRQHRASIRIQSLWRGFVTRRDTKSKNLTRARKRLAEANRTATQEKTLGSRTSSALDYLLREKDLAYILEALMHLEVSTRLSPVCCERMVEVNAVFVLYRLMNSCNRSVPHMELIKYACSILLNLAKYERTVAAVMEPAESIATIAELLQIYREKGAIFFNCCMLLGILGLHPGRRQRILQHPHIVDRLQSIHALSLRKQRASQNRQVTQAKMAAMRSFNCTLPVLTPSKSKRKRIRPEWALARDNIKDFEDPVAAVTFVMDSLHIGPKT